MPANSRPLAVVTGASTGIGFELARCCAEEGFDLIVAANEPAIELAAQAFRCCRRRSGDRPRNAGRGQQTLFRYRWASSGGVAGERRPRPGQRVS